MLYNIYTEESMNSYITTAQGVKMPCAAYIYLKGILTFDTVNFCIEDLYHLKDVYSTKELAKRIKALAEKGYYILVSDTGLARLDQSWKSENREGRIDIFHNQLEKPLYLKDLV